MTSDEFAEVCKIKRGIPADMIISTTNLSIPMNLDARKVKE